MPKLHPSLLAIWRNPIHLIAFGFGAGLMRFMPGTWGTFAAVPLYFLMQPLTLIYYVIIVCVAFIAGIWICGITARDLGVDDHPGIVWDEMVGFWITMIAAPAGWLWLAGAFILFRLFDILKPWPIFVLDKRVQGGLGIMLDDVMAAVYAGLCLQLITRVAV